ncbi:MAG TPA: flagellar biosynthesis protein FlhB [Clostridiales bacterium]|nr:flagellar biosynthesis protein FlhB [Clostridiales bacterium]
MLSFSINQAAIFLLILMRIISFLAATPLLSLRGIPSLLKIGLSLLLAYILYMVIPYQPMIEESLLAYGILAAKEILFGLALGYIVNLVFICFQMAGQMVDFQIGFSMATYYDPMSSNRVSLFGNLYYWIGITLFYAVNGHYYLIHAMVQSFELVPLTQLNFGQLYLGNIIQLFTDTFLIAFEIAMPIIFIVLLADVVMGIISRTVPQINILMLNLPLKMLLGILAAAALLPALINSLINAIENLPWWLNDFMQDMPLALAFAAGEKTEEPTPKRKDDARKKGQVAKSIDLNSAITLLLLIIFGNMMGNSLFSSLHKYLRHSLENGLTRSVTQRNLINIFLQDSGIYMVVVLPLMAGVMVIGVLASLMQTGLIRSTDPLKPDLNRLNPIQGFKNIFSQRAFIEFVKNFLKLILIGYLAWSFIRDNLQQILSITHISIRGVFPVVKDLILGLLTRVGIMMLILGAMDYLYQRFTFHKSLKMTKEEVKEELKQMEGDPQIRSLRRQKQRQLAMSRMMAAVPQADVVITNPTHLAVALKYDEKSYNAPVILAKGADYVAEKIREIAKKEEIAIVENKPLARALYYKGEVGREIPIELYQAVAEVLAMVYHMQGKMQQG